MDPPAPLRDRDPLDAVDAALELEAAPRPATLDEEDRVLDAPRTGRAGVHDLDFPALALRVLRVHAHEVRGEQRGLLAARASADLDEDVLRVVGIAREEQALQLVLERRLARREIVHLGLRELHELAVAALREEVTRLAEPPEHFTILGEPVDDVDRLGVLLSETRVLDRLREDGGIGQRAGDLVRSLFDLTELVKQHRAQRLPQQKTGWSPPQPVAERSLRQHALPLVLPLEALDAPGRVHKLLLAGVEGVALRADLHPDVGPGRAGANDLAARARDRRLHVLRMNTHLHDRHLLRDHHDTSPGQKRQRARELGCFERGLPEHLPEEKVGAVRSAPSEGVTPGCAWRPGTLCSSW